MSAKFQMRMLGVRERDIRELNIFEDVEGDYVGYYNFEEGTLEFVFKELWQLTICSPDSFKREIELGIGKIIKLRVEERGV